MINLFQANVTESATNVAEATVKTAETAAQAADVAAKTAETATEVVETAAKTADAAAQTVEAATEVVETASEGGAFSFLGDSWMTWVMIIAMIAIMYFFMIRPEKKRRKEMEEFRNGIKPGDKVITAGGIYAVVKKVEDTSLLIEVDSNVTLRIDKGMVVAAPTATQEQK